MDLALFALRLVVGLLFMGHGSQKLFGWFGGGGPQGTAGYFGTLGLQPARPLAVMAGLSEFTGGLLLALGLLSPLAALLIAAVMFTAILSVHWPRVWVSEGGLEYPLVNVAVVFASVTAGPGAWSLDAVVGLPEAWGALWAAGALALAMTGAAAVVLIGRRIEARSVRHSVAEREAAGEPVQLPPRETSEDRLTA
jgi:putative oxidoreductase